MSTITQPCKPKHQQPECLIVITHIDGNVKAIADSMTEAVVQQLRKGDDLALVDWDCCAHSGEQVCSPSATAQAC
jgi:hypothetical protein